MIPATELARWLDGRPDRVGLTPCCGNCRNADTGGIIAADVIDCTADTPPTRLRDTTDACPRFVYDARPVEERFPAYDAQFWATAAHTSTARQLARVAQAVKAGERASVQLGGATFAPTPGTPLAQSAHAGTDRPKEAA